MFLKVAQVLLLDVLCSRMAVLLISSPTLSLDEDGGRRGEQRCVSNLNTELKLT